MQGKVLRPLWACKGIGCFEYKNTYHNDIIDTRRYK